MFSDTLKNAIRDVSGMIAGELQVGEDEDFALTLAETTLDAGRLAMNGHREAQEELRSPARHVVVGRCSGGGEEICLLLISFRLFGRQRCSLPWTMG